MSDITPKPPKEIQVPDEAPHTIGTFFLDSLLGAWVLAGTIIGAILAFALGKIFNSEPAVIVGVVLLIFLYVQCFFSWKAQRQKIDTLNLQIQALKDQLEDKERKNRPLLDGYIRNIGAQNWFDAKTKQLLGIRLYIGLAIVNHNKPPTGIVNFSLDITSARNSYHIPTTKEYSSTGKLAVITQYLPNYFANPKNRAKRFAFIEGGVVFEVRDMLLSECTDGSTQYTVKIRDALGNQHCIQRVDNPKYEGINLFHLDDRIPPGEVRDLSANISKKD